MTEQKDINKIVEELEQFIMLEGTEWGEMLQLCTQLWEYEDYFSERLRKALEAEIIAQHKWAINNLEIVETEETFSRKVRTLEQKS